MNPDENHNDCSNPEQTIEDEEYLIRNLYNAGSVVWGKVEGYPWWPAMVDDDPDVEDYFWLEENIEQPVSIILFHWRIIEIVCVSDLLSCHIFRSL